MTTEQAAEKVGVSATTVSRDPGSPAEVAPSTIDAPRRPAGTSYATRRRPGPRLTGTSLRGRRIGFFIVEYSLNGSVPAYDPLLRGVSTACNNAQLELQVGFIDAHDNVVRRLKNGRFDGLVLHGTPPSDVESKALQDIPTVWLMGGRRRPGWGDQVMPDNGLIGQTAANYLLRQGHRNVVYFGLNISWSLNVRAVSFQQAIEDAGAQVTIMNEPVTDATNLDVSRYAIELFKTIRAMPTRPTGLFVGEDWLLRPLYAAAAEAGVRIGTDLEIISCNLDRPHLLGLTPVPATIDIRFELIGSRGVEQLIQRLQGVPMNDRVRIMIEPSIALPAMVSEEVGQAARHPQKQIHLPKA